MRGVRVPPTTFASDTPHPSRCAQTKKWILSPLYRNRDRRKEGRPVQTAVCAMAQHRTRLCVGIYHWDRADAPRATLVVPMNTGYGNISQVAAYFDNGAANRPTAQYTGIVSPKIPSLYMSSTLPQIWTGREERSRSLTPNLGNSPNVSGGKGEVVRAPVRSTSRTSSQHPSQPSPDGQLQWKQQCQISGERTSNYLASQRFRGRLDARPTPWDGAIRLDTMKKP